MGGECQKNISIFTSHYADDQVVLAKDDAYVYVEEVVRGEQKLGPLNK